MNDELHSLDATAQAELVARGELTSLELVNAAIARIEALDPKLGALASADFERARQRAETPLTGPFAGVPFLVKDLVPYPGLPHTMGCRLFASQTPTEASPYAQRLDAAGLVVLGKTTTSEFGLLGSTETLLHGVTHNPWDPTRSAGGSSGGSAAAVAARLVPMAHASDGGGSIRIPAAMNGLFGLKPSGGRLVASLPDDMHGLVVDHCVSISVRDSARLLAATERQDTHLPKVGFVGGASSKRLRIGYYATTLMGAAPSPGAQRSLEHAVGLCRELGHVVEPIDPPPIDGAAVGDAFFTVAGATMAGLDQTMHPMLGRALGADDLEPFTLELIEWFRSLPDGAFATALASFETIGAATTAHLETVDVTLCPTTPTDLFELGTLAPSLPKATLLRRTEQLAGYTPIHNIAKAPAMSVPLCNDADGLPRGVHFAAAPGHEARLLALAYELEAASPWADRRPSLAR